MSAREHLWYWVVPVIVLTIMMSLFFSSNPDLIKLINPKRIDPLANKEWGILENIQLLIIIGILVVTSYATVKIRPWLPRLGFALLTLFTVVIFLEEIDYGYHFSEYFTGEGESQLSNLVGVYNLHNIYDNFGAIYFKRFVYLVMLVLFILMPFWQFSPQRKILNYVAPLPKIIIPAGITIATEIIARALIPVRGLTTADLQMDIGEFSEIMIYYAFLLYLCQVVFEKTWGEAVQKVPEGDS